MQKHFADRLAAACERCGTAAVVGIDPVVEKLPDELRPAHGGAAAAASALERFAAAVTDAVAGLVPAVKINAGFFEAFRGAGLAAYYRSVAYAQRRGLLVIGDIKRGDIGSTAELYARGHLATPDAQDDDGGGVPDAVTLAGYLGENAVRPFIEIARETGRGVYVLVRPSEPKADEVHEFGGAGAGGERFYQHMAKLVRDWGAAPELRGRGGWSCVGAVVAPKDRASTAALREALPHTPWLVPGYGAQGGTAEDCRACFRDGAGAVVNASRSVIYAYQAAAARERFGDDWRAAIRAAAESFAADVAGIMRG